MDFIISVLLILSTLFVCDSLRGVNRRSSPTLPRALVADFLLGFEQCVSAFELGAIMDHYGLAFWSIGLFMMVVYQCLRWRQEVIPSPSSHLLNHLSGKKTIFEVLLRSSILMVSGLLSYRFVKCIWSLELSSLHVNRPSDLDSCVFPWPDVPTQTAFAAEFIGSFLLVLGPTLVAENQTLANNDPVYTAIVIAVIVYVCIYLALGYSGGLFNPMLASVLFGGCEGHSMIEHILIYWVGSTAGAVVGFKVLPKVRNMVYKIEDEKKME